MWWEDLTRGRSEHIFHFLNCGSPGARGSGGWGALCVFSQTQLEATLYLRGGGTGAPDAEIPSHSGSRAAHWKRVK